jgi:hypothetical protein
MDDFMLVLGGIGILMAIVLFMWIWADSESVAVRRTLELHYDPDEVDYLMSSEEFTKTIYPQIAEDIKKAR